MHLSSKFCFCLIAMSVSGRMKFFRRAFMVPCSLSSVLNFLIDDMKCFVVTVSRSIRVFNSIWAGCLRPVFYAIWNNKAGQ